MKLHPFFSVCCIFIFPFDLNDYNAQNILRVSLVLSVLHSVRKLLRTAAGSRTQTQWSFQETVLIFCSELSQNIIVYIQGTIRLLEYILGAKADLDTGE